MATIVLISCVSKKRSQKSKASDLYISALFKKNLQYARNLNPDKIFILSAKYGLVELDDEIEPYDQTLNTMSSSQIKQWAKSVLGRLAESTDFQRDRFIFLAGAKYRGYLISQLRNVETPLEGLRIGEQLKRLNDEGRKSNESK